MSSKLIAVLTALILIVAACGGGSTTPSEAATGSPAGSNAPGSPAGSNAPGSPSAVEITIGTDTDAGLKFDPATVTVPAGATVHVTFENRATVPHNLTFEAPINVASPAVVYAGTTATLEFTAPAAGEYAFKCTIHPGMGGTLTVQGG